MQLREGPFTYGSPAIFDDRNSPPSLGEVHAAQQLGEARLRAEVVKAGIVFYPDQPRGAILVSLLQLFERVIFIAEAGVDDRQLVGRDVALFRQLPQPLDLLRASPLLPDRA